MQNIKDKTLTVTYFSVAFHKILSYNKTLN